MTHTPRTAPVQHGVTIQMPAFSTPMAATIMLVALGGLTTQAIEITTGRDFVFGLIPKFDPSAPRNLPVWFASVVLAACAAACALAALGARSIHGRGVARLWWCSGLLALLSVDRLSGLVEQLTVAGAAGDVTTVNELRDAVLVACGLAALLLCLRDVPREPRERLQAAGTIGMLGWLVCATAAGPDVSAARDARVARMVTIVFGHALELASVTLFLATLGALAASQFRHVVVSVDDSLPRPADVGPGPGGVEIRLSVSGISRALAVAIGAILAASLLAAYARHAIGQDAEDLYRFLFVDFEGNLPTWFSSLLLLVCAAVTGLIARARSEVGDARWWHWAGFALLFAALSADEAASLHELSVLPLRAALRESRWLWFPLAVPGVILFGGVWVTFRTFLATLPTDTRRALHRGGGVFITGALAVETVGGWFDPVLYGENATYVVLATLEEGCEMWGIATILGGLLRHLEAVGPLRIACGPQEPVASGPIGNVAA